MSEEGGDLNFEASLALGFPVGGWPAVCGRRPAGSEAGLEALLAAVARTHGLHAKGIRGRRGSMDYARARQHFMWSAYETGNYSLPRIAQFLGRDHSTVLHGVRKFAERLVSGELSNPSHTFVESCGKLHFVAHGTDAEAGKIPA